MTIQDAGGLPFDQDVLTFTDDTKRQVDAAVVHLREPLAPGATTKVSLTYGGHIVPYTEIGWLYVKDHVGEDFTMIRSDALAFPVLGTLSEEIDHKMPYPSFTYDVRVTVPKGYIAAAGALVDQREVDDKTQFHFATAERVPYVNIAIAKFQVSDEGGVRVYSLPADDAGAKVVAQKTRDEIALLTKWFGPLTHPPRVTIIEIPTGWGSQAHLIAGIILTAETFQDPKWLFELYHEVAHFWNPAANDSPSPRLNEGLATWMEGVVSESLDQIPSDHGKRMSAQVLQRAADDSRVQTVPLMAYGTENMTGWSYRVGDLYFHLLDAAIGREALLGVLRDWYQTHKTSGATLQDFTSLLESRYPKTKAIDDDWIRSTAWLAKLRDIPSPEQLAAKY